MTARLVVPCWVSFTATLLKPARSRRRLTRRKAAYRRRRKMRVAGTEKCRRKKQTYSRLRGSSTMALRGRPLPKPATPILTSPPTAGCPGCLPANPPPEARQTSPQRAGQPSSPCAWLDACRPWATSLSSSQRFGNRALPRRLFRLLFRSRFGCAPLGLHLQRRSDFLLLNDFCFLLCLFLRHILSLLLLGFAAHGG